MFDGGLVSWRYYVLYIILNLHKQFDSHLHYSKIILHLIYIYLMISTIQNVFLPLSAATFSDISIPTSFTYSFLSFIFFSS
jgi:hypothetical protein